MAHCFGVDIGNSGLRVAALDVSQSALGHMLRINWRPASAEFVRRCDQQTSRYLPDDTQWTLRLSEFLERQAVAPTTTDTRWLISSVRRDALEVLQRYLRTETGHQVTVVDHSQLPLAIAVEAPERVGIDRLLAALAATEITTARPAIVVQAGSAVTVDLLSSAPATLSSSAATALTVAKRSPQQLLGTFEGGAIIPGVPMMLRLLGTGADLLPQIDADDLLELPRLPGKNTEQAMVCGTASALVGGVTHLISRYRAAFGADVPVILSGGDGMRLAQYISAPLIDRPHLVHHGLLKLAAIELT